MKANRSAEGRAATLNSRPPPHPSRFREGQLSRAAIASNPLAVLLIPDAAAELAIHISDLDIHGRDGLRIRHGDYRRRRLDILSGPLERLSVDAAWWRRRPRRTDWPIGGCWTIRPERPGGTRRTIWGGRSFRAVRWPDGASWADRAASNVSERRGVSDAGGRLDSAGEQQHCGGLDTASGRACQLEYSTHGLRSDQSRAGLRNYVERIQFQRE
jgi:hypothetical protein